MALGNGTLSLFRSSTSTAAKPVKETKKEISPVVTTTDISPESICTGEQFTLIEGVLSGSIKITPTIAAEWLERNTRNFRKLREAIWKKYAVNLSKGQWDYNGESIKFDPEGVLLDGQHRLKACVESGVSFVSPVFYGVKSALNIDIGDSRNQEQVLESEGIGEARIISAAINKLHNYSDAGSVGFKTVGHGRNVLTRQDALEFATENASSLQHSVVKTKKSNQLFNRWSLHVALHFLFAKTAGEALADDFYETLQTGAGLPVTSPIYHLRERLTKEKAKKHQKLDTNPYAGMIIKGWNYWISGQEVSLFRYDWEKDKIAKIKRSPISK